MLSIKEEKLQNITEDLRVRYDDDGATMAAIAAMLGATVEQAAAILAKYTLDRQRKSRRKKR